MRRNVKMTIAVLLSFLVLAPYGFGAEGAPDAWITLKSKVAILSEIGTDGTDINVDTVNGRVTLHGTIPTKEAKDQTESIVKKIDGVKEIRNLLAVVPPESKERVQVADARIESRVSEALNSDALLKGSQIDVKSVNDGMVMLGGEAENLSIHLHAIEVAKSIEGVRSVRSQIQSEDARAAEEAWKDYQDVGSSKRSGEKDMTSTFRDLFITAATKTRLLTERQTPGLDINVDTENGVVTLFGTVSSEEEKIAAELQARKVDGVKQVVNQLKVNSEME